MGFDNECILNIQSLAGEYFCPVCRLLVLPNEALQSQCTHLYCKPCLTYIVSTTKACPYDGYLVTEADSKPLTESNKALAETISKITVHCLYHRSGCTWQGTLSDCLVHCSGCAFGNSPVVCNRCSIQIVHRQVQEHAQNCPGVPQAQQVSAQVATTTTTTAGDQTASQTGIATSQAQTSQSNTITAAGQVSNSNSQAQVTAPVAAVSSDQWYQQQYQQYYQQYANYEAYYQQYYPYQQQAVPQVAQQNQQVHGSGVTGQQQLYAQAPQQLQQQGLAQGQSQSQSQPQPQPQPHLPAQPQQQSLGQPQLYSSAQNVAAQSQNVAHINQQQQPSPYIAPSQISSQSQTQPPVQGHYSQAQVLPQVQSHSQFQPVQLQVQQAQAQILQQPQAQLNLQVQPHAQPQTQPQIHASQPSQPLNTSLPSQHPAAHAVTGNQSYPQPQPQPRPQMQLVGVQHPLQMHLQGGFHSQFPHQAHVQSSHSQMQPLQSHAPTANQQNPPLLPSPVPALQQQLHPNAHQSGLPVQQLSMMQQAPSGMPQPYVLQPLSGQPVAPLQNQMSQHMPLVQQHLPVQSHSRPLGAPHLQQHSQAYLQQTQNNASGHTMRPFQLQHNVARPPMLNHGMPSHPFTPTSVEVRPKQLPTNRPPAPVSKTPGDKVADKHVGKVDCDAFVISKNKSEVGVKSEANINPAEEKAIGEVGDGGRGDDSLKNISESSKTVKTESELNAVGVSGIDNAAEENIIGEQTDVSQFNMRKNENSFSESKESNGGSLTRMPLLHDEGKSEEHGRKLQSDQVQPHGQVIPKDLGPTDFKDSQLRHERQKHVPGHLVSNAVQKRPPGSGFFQGPPSGPHVHTQPSGLPPNQFRPQGPGHTALPENLTPGPFGMGPSNHPPQGPHLGAPRMPQGDSVGRPTLGMPRFTSLDSHGGPPYGTDSGLNPNTFTRLNGGPGFESHGFRNNRMNPVHDEQMDKFRVNIGRHISGQGQVDGDFLRFPRPPHLDVEPLSKFGSHYSSSSLDKGPLGPNFDPSVDSVFSRNFPPYRSVGRMPPNDAGERLVGPHDDPIGKREFAGPVPAFGRRYMDNFQSGSPGGEHPGMSPRFRGHHGDDIDHREHRFSRFPGLHRAEFDGPDNFHMAEFMGRDLPPSHLRRGDFMDPRSLPPDLRFREAGGFGPFSTHDRMGEFARPGDIHHRLREPGFRSSFSLQGFAKENRVFGADADSFENVRKRKPTSMGWCRICKVDCETVEGLELHSQTREHQKMAMDMVALIKQNSKKQKLNSSDRSVANDAKKLRNTNFEGRGNKH